MATFTYQARNDLGRPVSGVLEADTEDAVDSTLRARGLYVTSVSERVAVEAQKAAPTLALSRRDLVLLTLHIATVLSSGIPIVEGLVGFADEAPNRRLKAITLSLLEGVRGGASLSEVMARYPRAFPDIYINLVRAGETIGRVDKVLFELVASLEWQARIVSEIRQAAVYPVMLLSGVSIMLTLIVTIVMPRFLKALQKVNAPIPAPTRVVMAFGEFLNEHWMTVIAGGVIVFIATRLYVGTREGRRLMDTLKLRIPVLGELIRKIGMSRFAHHLSQLHMAGVDFVVALTVVENVVGNAVLADAIGRARERVVAGSSLTEALRVTRQFPPLVLQMVATGETTGNLGETLNKVAEYYDREVPATVKRVSTIVEPLVYVILGVVVLGTALALYSPMLAMLQNLQVRPRF